MFLSHRTPRFFATDAWQLEADGDHGAADPLVPTNVATASGSGNIATKLVQRKHSYTLGELHLPKMLFKVILPSSQLATRFIQTYHLPSSFYTHP